MASLAETLAAAVHDPHGYTHRLPPSLAAINAIQPPLTEQEMNLYRHHLMNMRPGKWIQQPDGSTSTVIQNNVGGEEIGGDPGRAYNIPSVWNGKELSGDALYNAIQPASQWPSYNGSYIPGAPVTRYENADARYVGQMHDAMQLDTMPSSLLYPRKR